MDRAEYSHATAVWGAQQAVVSNLTDNVDWYNALLHNAEDESSTAAAKWLHASPGWCSTTTDGFSTGTCKAALLLGPNWTPMRARVSRILSTTMASKSQSSGGGLRRLVQLTLTGGSASMTHGRAGPPVLISSQTQLPASRQWSLLLRTIVIVH